MIPLTRPLVGAEEAEAAGRVIRAGALDQGAEVAAFEREVAAYVGAAHACAVTSGATAIHIALDALGVGAGDEVIASEACGTAVANAILRCGARPVFIDVEADGLNIDPASVANVITRRTRAIVCTHAMGMPCDLHAILALASAHQIAVVEDATAALGAQILHAERWDRIGRPHGDIAVFSFGRDAVIAAGEGGMLTTNRPELDAAFRWRRLHGVPAPGASARRSHAQEPSGPASAPAHPMTDMQAAIGRQQVRRLSAVIARRRALASRYAVMLRVCGSDLTLPNEPSWARSNWHGYCVMLARNIDPERVAGQLHDAGIATGRTTSPVHGKADEGGGGRARDGHARGIVLPLFPQMSDSEQQSVVRALLSALRRTNAAGTRLMLVKR